MPSLTEWRVPPAYQPRSGDYNFDLDRALSSVVGLHSIIPADAFTAETLGTERAGNGVVVGGAGGRTRSVASQIAARQEFAGYWEYLLEDAIFTYPAHPNWGGTALISAAGELIGIGSLQLEREREGKAEHVNMIVPIDLFKPVIDDLRKFGRVNKPARPWLGMYSTEIDNKVVVIGISANGPAARA